MNRPLWSELDERINILRRVCARGRSLFLTNEDSIGVDMFEHMENEVNLLANVVSTLENQAARPARGVVDKDVVIQAERAFWPAYNEALRVHGTKADCHAIGMRAALQAAALPAVPDGELRVTVFHQSGDDPFIYAVHGKATVRDLASIEADLRGDYGDLLSRGDGDYLLSARYLSGEYDEMGRCEQPAGWELHVESFAATPAHDQPEGESRES